MTSLIVCSSQMEVDRLKHLSPFALLKGFVKRQSYITTEIRVRLKGKSLSEIIDMQGIYINLVI